MRAVITADIPDDIPVLSNTIHNLLVEALEEFREKRKDAWEYVKWRHPNGHLGDHANDAYIIATVKNLVHLAHALKTHTVRFESDHDRERDRIHCDEPSA